jgi:hypothetical protein
MDGWIPLEADKSSFVPIYGIGTTADKIGFDWVCFE